MSTEEYEFHLSGTQDPDGQISLAEFGILAGKLQELATRVARWSADIHGPGRSPALLAEIAHLRLVGLSDGSARLFVTRGGPGTLDVEEDIEKDLSRRFWDVIAGISADVPPSDAPQPVRESAVGVLDALGRIGESVSVTRLRDNARAQFQPAERSRTVWLPEPVPSAVQQTVHGTLEMVDLHSATFRVRDAVGNGITLYGVKNPDAVAESLVNRRVEATGTRSAARKGPALDTVTVVPAEPLPTEWTQAPGEEGWKSRLDANPDPVGVLDVDDDDWAAFTAALQAQ